jgi:CRP/FNR family transcriptional regulator, cyclic AMP receptor protein
VAAAMDARMSLKERVRPFLRSSTFFGGFSDVALDGLITYGHSKSYGKGDILYRRGEPGEGLAVLLTGRIKITNTSSDGREVVLNFLGPGDIVGEIAALDGKKRTADAVALEACEVFAIQSRDLLPTLVANPTALLEIVQILCEKLRSTSAIIEDNALAMRSRTARGLLRLAQQHGRTSKDGIRLQLPISQRELGGYLGLSRENVSRQLGQLKDTNVIKIAGSEIIIIDEQGLALIADE